MTFATKSRPDHSTRRPIPFVAKFLHFVSNTATEMTRYLTRQRITAYLPVFILLLWAPYSRRHFIGSFPESSVASFIKSDFLAYYTSGKFALSGGFSDLYSLAAQFQMQDKLLASVGREETSPFISPPFVSYLYAPLAALPYSWAAAGWIALTVVFLVLSVRLIWPLVPNVHHFGFARVLAVILASYPMVDLISSGQNSALTLLLMIAGLRLLISGSNGGAGVVLGIGVYKPQLFILFPLSLILERQWKAVACWAAVSMSLGVLSIWMVGVSGIRSYVSLLTSDVYNERILGEFGWKMNTVGSLLRSFVPEEFLPGIAFTVINLAVLTVGALLLVKAHQRIRRSLTGIDAVTLGFAVTVLISTSFTPHVFNYDSILLTLPFLLVLNAFPTSSMLKLSIAGAYVISMTTPWRSLAFAETGWPLNILAAPWGVVPVIACLFVVLGCMNSRRDVRQREDVPTLSPHHVTGG